MIKALTTQPLAVTVRMTAVGLILLTSPGLSLKAQLPAALESQIRQEMSKVNEGQPRPEAQLGSDQDRAKQTVISKPPREGLRPAANSAFQDYVNREASQLGLTEPLRPFAASLVREEEQSFSPSSNYAVPDDYRLAPGDELLLQVWGTYETERLLRVDRRGYIKPPVVPEIKVAGLKYGDLTPIVRKSFAKIYEGFDLSITMGQLRGIRVYVTGFSSAPGAYTVSNLSTLVNVVLTSGGPSAAGSFRSVKLIRQGKVISQFDLYDLLLRGDKSSDKMLLPEDIIHVEPKMSEAAIAGAVHRPGIYELKPGETLDSLLQMAGGLLPIADSQVLRRLSVSEREKGFKDVEASSPGVQVAPGDLYVALNRSAIQMPSQNKMMHVRIEGEVKNPGLLLLPPGTDLRQAIEQAGGLSVGAFIFGTVLTRPSIRREQGLQLDKARREVRRVIALAATKPTGSLEETVAVERQLKVSQAILEESTQVSPSGRVVLGIQATDTFLPAFPLQDGDSILIPDIPQIVGVFGSVVNPGVFEYRNAPTSKEVIDSAGGISYGADEKRTFVVSANGQTRATARDRGFWLVSSDHKPLPLLPGDTVYVPDDLEPKFNLVRELKDWTGILTQFVTGAAAIKILQE